MHILPSFLELDTFPSSISSRTEHLSRDLTMIMVSFPTHTLCLQQVTHRGAPAAVAASTMQTSTLALLLQTTEKGVLKSQHPNLLITELAVSQGSAGNPHSFFSREPTAVCSEAPGLAYLMNPAPYLPHMLWGKDCPFPTGHGVNASSGPGGPEFLVLYFYCKNNPHKLQ